MKQLVEALHYKQEGRGFDSRWCHNPSGRTMTLGSSQPRTEIRNRNISWELKATGANGMTIWMCRLSRNLGTVWAWIGLHRDCCTFIYISNEFLFEHVKEISYLGLQMNQTNCISSEIQARILSGNRCYYAYGKLMKSRALTLRRLMSYIYIYIYIYGAPILDVSRSHTTTHHSR